MSKAWRQFRFQKNTAKKRGVSWELTFDEWMGIWAKSGHYGQRGRGGYVMARKGDVGPYSPQNVEIITWAQNSKDARANHPKTAFQLSALAIGKGRGWTLRSNGKYQVTCAKRYIGQFKSQAEAESAYAAAIESRLASLSKTVAGISFFAEAHGSHAA